MNKSKSENSGLGFIDFNIIVLRFNDTSNPCGSFCIVSQRKGEKVRRDSREDEREGWRRKREMKESE